MEPKPASLGDGEMKADSDIKNIGVRSVQAVRVGVVKVKF